MSEKQYIEREAAVNAIMGEPTDAPYPGWYAGKIAALPAAPVREVVRGKWVWVIAFERCEKPERGRE